MSHLETCTVQVSDLGEIFNQNFVKESSDSTVPKLGEMDTQIIEMNLKRGWEPIYIQYTRIIKNPTIFFCKCGYINTCIHV